MKKAYRLFRGEVERVRWKRLICNNYATPKSKIIMWISFHNRLSTVEMINCCGINGDTSYSLCMTDVESVQHLFFSCEYADEISKSICMQMNFDETGCNFQEAVSKACNQARKNSGRLFVMLFT